MKHRVRRLTQLSVLLLAQWGLSRAPQAMFDCSYLCTPEFFTHCEEHCKGDIGSVGCTSEWAICQCNGAMYPNTVCNPS